MRRPTRAARAAPSPSLATVSEARGGNPWSFCARAFVDTTTGIGKCRPVGDCVLLPVQRTNSALTIPHLTVCPKTKMAFENALFENTFLDHRCLCLLLQYLLQYNSVRRKWSGNRIRIFSNLKTERIVTFDKRFFFAILSQRICFCFFAMAPDRKRSLSPVCTALGLDHTGEFALKTLPYVGCAHLRGELAEVSKARERNNKPPWRECR